MIGPSGKLAHIGKSAPGQDGKMTTAIQLR